MRLTTILSPALIAATTAFAADADSSSSSSSSASIPLESTKPEPPTPLGALWTPKWTSSSLTPYTTRCHSSFTFTPQIFQLGEMYPTLKDFAPELKVFYHRQHYPGSWNGEDKHGDKRELLKMEYEDLPYGVREWLGKEENKKQRFFSVQEEYVFFAPGAIYKILPLWVDESGERGCHGVFEDLDSYAIEAKDGAVLGKVEHKSTGKNQIEITIEAFQVNEKDSGRARDEL